MFQAPVAVGVSMPKWEKFGDKTQGNIVWYPNMLLNRVRSKRKKCFTMFDVIYQTRATVFHRDIQTPRREVFG